MYMEDLKLREGVGQYDKTNEGMDAENGDGDG